MGQIEVFVIEIGSGSTPVDNTYCELYTSCGNKSTKLVTAGCIHEHIHTSGLCDQCLEEMQANIIYCTDCMDAGLEGDKAITVHVIRVEELPQ